MALPTDQALANQHGFAHRPSFGQPTKVLLNKQSLKITFFSFLCLRKQVSRVQSCLLGLQASVGKQHGVGVGPHRAWVKVF
jgi:hypothetical protein